MTAGRRAILDLLSQAGVVTRKECEADRVSFTFLPLSSDGSARRFLRVMKQSRSLCVAVMPGTATERELAESRSAATIARHLAGAGAPVPAVIADDPELGIVLFEDLGDQRLHDQLKADRQQAIERYPEVVASLARMQVKAAEKFRTEWCFDAPFYDREVMLVREAEYFIRAFWQDTLYGEPVVGLREECEDLAEQAESLFERFFLHRDFQCRNLMVQGDRIVFIDFQAGRLGPPGYDIASLLIDPYAALSDRLQDDLLSRYLQEMSGWTQVDCDKLRQSYGLLAVQRNLQIIGAYSFLSGQKHKPFFRPYILPSLVMLQNRLTERRFDNYRVLRQTVAEAIRRYRAIVR